MSQRHVRLLVGVAVSLCLAAPLSSQEPLQRSEVEPIAEALRVFVDCERFICDMDHIRAQP